MQPLGSLLSKVEALVAEAGQLLREEFYRSNGPRGAGEKAPIDTEIEEYLRQGLAEITPDYSVEGEELSDFQGSDPDYRWVLDPQDGTSAFLRGFRGSSISVGLLRKGKPVLGVVHAPLYPNDAGDMICGASAVGVFRNGKPISVEPCPEPLSASDVVAVSQDADQRIEFNLTTLRPARYLAMPSVAYRLALAAVGEVRAGMSLAPLRPLDVAAGHALLLAANRELRPLNEADSIDYECGGWHGIIGGDPTAIEALTPWDWNRGLGPKQTPKLLFPSPKVSVAGPELARAQGCLLGLIAGDSLGALVEFRNAEWIAQRPGGVEQTQDGGTWDTLAGQPTDDGEMALSLARSLLHEVGFREEAVRKAYRRWIDSGPFDMGRTVQSGILGSVNIDSQANGSLMRCAPLGLVYRPDAVRTVAYQESSITHPNPLCGECCRVFCQTISRAIEGVSPREAFDAALDDSSGEVRQLLEQARIGPPEEFVHQMGWVKIAFVNAFYHLFAETGLKEAVVQTVRQGGDTDTNAAIVGALLGSFQGYEAVPAQWRRSVLSCRPHPSNRASFRHRPTEYWPVDLLLLAETLLSLRKKLS